MKEIVRTNYGLVRGIHGNNPAVMVFKGIPYAAPPVGPLRFRPPQPPVPWEGVRPCREFSPISLQPSVVAGVPFGDFFRKEFYPVDELQSEDSLYLNIWTGAKDPDEKQPVMFWIHGGGLASGYGHEMEFDGEALAKKGVILVTSNFRLGPVGFFAHPELSGENPHGVSGNNTLLDHYAALRWVRENIAFFGGDPNNITVFGQSGGAAATISALISPLAEGMFHKAIIQSGISGVDLNTFGHWTLEQAEQWGVEACRALGMTIEDLKALPGDKLLDAFTYAEEHGAGRCPQEVQDGYVLPCFPQEAGAMGLLRDLPIMTGMLSGDKNEMFALPGYRDKPEEEIAVKCFAEHAQEFLRQHPPAAEPSIYTYLRKTEGFYDSISFAERHISRGKKAPYLYYFDAWMPGKIESGFVPEGTAYHSAELLFMFGTLGRSWRDFDGRYYDLSDRMVSYWASFARSDDPNGPGLPKWNPYSPETKNVMRFNEKCVWNESRSCPELDTAIDFFRSHPQKTM